MMMSVCADGRSWYVDLSPEDCAFLLDIMRAFGSLCHAVVVLECTPNCPLYKERERLGIYIPHLDRIKRLSDYITDRANHVDGPPRIIYYE